MEKESNNRPKVSVLTPIYNTDPQYLKECIESILDQTFTDFEFLLLNDSPDNVMLDEIVASYHDERIKYFKNDYNMGISASRNKLLKFAKGQYLAIFDHDDISMPNRLELEVQYLDSHPGVGVVSGLVENIGGKSGYDFRPEHNYLIKAYLTENCVMAHTGAMIRINVLRDNNIFYEEQYSPAEDYRLWERLFSVTEFYNIQQVVVKYRRYLTQTSNLQVQKMKIAHHTISLELKNSYPAYWEYFRYHCKMTIWEICLFGFIPIAKQKGNWVYLFGTIPFLRVYSIGDMK